MECPFYHEGLCTCFEYSLCDKDYCPCSNELNVQKSEKILNG